MYKKSLSVVFRLFFCLIVIISSGLFASPVNEVDADLAIRGWLRYNDKPMTYAISKDARESVGYSDEYGRILYYIVELEPQGFVVCSADDELEPVIAFSVNGSYRDLEGNPFRELLVQDMTERLDSIKSKKGKAAVKSAQQGKWQTLLDAGMQTKSDIGFLGGVLSVSDVRVMPLVESQWSQDEAGGDYCYNYYTPNHYVSGCVATAMSQLMRYHTWPISGIGVHSCLISVDGVDQYWNTRGGDGAGGAYNWSDMPYIPDYSMTSVQCQAIGALCYDAGLSVEMSYTSNYSSASSKDASDALRGTFGYSNSVYGQGFSSSGDDGLWGMINANLDAKLPVILSISGPVGGHAVIADGYGYSSGTMYHHLNMGWGGTDDTWYALPVIDSSYSFNVINGCVYNVYPVGTGEIISGRVTSMAGAALEGVTITAYIGSTVVAQETTDSYGIYALQNIPANTTCKISASKSEYAFVDQNAVTGQSQDWSSVSGNKWGVDFSAANPMPPSAMNQEVTVHCQSTEIITLDFLDDNLPDPPGAVMCVITSLPVHGSLNVPGAEEIDSVPYTLPGNAVEYVPCYYYGGSDSFTFKANDGGIAPTGGDSDIATISIVVDNTLTSEFGLDGTFSTNTAIDTRYYASRSQCLYLAEDIGGEKYLTDLALKFTGIPPLELNEWTIRMQQTDKSQYTDVANDFLTDGWTQVYQGDLEVSQSGWVNMHFDTPFYFDGINNLLIDYSFDNSSVSSQTGWYFCKEIGCGCNRVITKKTDSSTHTSPLTWDFWYGGGGWWGGDWLPSLKLIGQVPTTVITGDFNYSCLVNLPDMAIFAEAWNTQEGQSDYNPECDISAPKDDKVDILDLQVFAESWLSE